MRKITILLSLCLACMGLTATAQGTTDNLYPVNFDKNATLQRNDRATRGVSLSSPCYGTQTLTMENNGKNAWNDRTSSIWLAKAGETLSVAFDYMGAWMHKYVFIDTDSDGFTSSVAADGYTPQEDLYAFNYYREKTSTGAAAAGNGSTALPSFTAPTTPGTYRMRLKVDWDNIDPAGDGSLNKEDNLPNIVHNGGSVIDIMLTVTEGEASEFTGTSILDRTTWTVTAQNETALGNEPHPSGPAIAMLDGNESSYWHSDWVSDGTPGSRLPQAFTIDLGSEQEIAGFAYLPRPGLNNGTCATYKMFVSNSPYNVRASDFSIPSENPFMEGNFDYSNERTELKTVTSANTTNGRYILFVSTSSHTGQFFSCAEFYLLNPQGAEKIRSYNNNIEKIWLDIAASDAYNHKESLATASAQNHYLPGYIPESNFASINLSFRAVTAALTTDYNYKHSIIRNNIHVAAENLSGTIPTEWPTDVYFTITNTNGRGSVIYDPTKSNEVDGTNYNAEYLQEATAADANNKDHLWGFYKNGNEYYLYNVGKRLFANIGRGDYGETWIFSDRPVALNLEVLSPIPAIHIKGGNKTMSISTSYTGPIITYYYAGDQGVPFKLEASSVPVDDDVTAAIAKLVELAPARTAAYEALSKTGVGYPTVGGSARTTLLDAINNSTAASDIEAATTAYKSNTTDIQMPEDGKVYVIRNPHPDGKVYTLKFNGTTLSMAADATGNDDSEKFICRAIGGNKYAFVNAKNGKFMIYYGVSVTHPYPETTGGTATGFVASYNILGHTECDLILTSKANLLFGTLSIAGKRNRTQSNGYATMTIGNDGTMNANGGDNNAIYTSAYSSVFTFEEVAYPNKPELQAADGIEGIDGLATFSAPFATVVPTGVTAWYATDNYNETEGWISMAQLATEGQAIPANQGVILTGATGQVTMIPATDETQGTVTGNLLGNSAGADKELSASTDYILANKEIDGNNVVAFYALNTDGDQAARTLGMNKAYLDLSSLPATTNYSVKMNFGGNVSGIQAVEKADDPDAPVYDLSGRRVTVASKGGVYIRNGKKFIVK